MQRKVHNIIKAITKLPQFIWMIKILKVILAYFGSSTYAKVHLHMQFKGDDGEHVSVLQNIGKT
ncbi:hypothetical protein HETIRDRAFT_419482 [Heterobasidion irregulare TC 32-1]|uniref:Uncharacterized protein n=1 Tax=Heterobasidion irregulare (strain TC 32-1) TaxID=747525 RepID=W4K1Z4_HETIT|nr:uncharacterized protein HETIRDRAFT_419482 [Heterobasidion irregulare TC 32-1]ETW79828.1 hypothetical protein HETIRDRAFT_419482 [Heterobasidion irregulare TC 32-1]